MAHELDQTLDRISNAVDEIKRGISELTEAMNPSRYDRDSLQVTLSDSSETTITSAIDAGIADVVKALESARSQGTQANVSIGMDSIEPDIRAAFNKALENLNIQANVELRAIGVDLAGINQQIQETIQQGIQKAVEGLDVQANVELKATGVDLTSINQQIQQAIQQAIQTANLTVPINFDIDALRQVLLEVRNSSIQQEEVLWNYEAAFSEAPPNEALLDKAGKAGFELVNVAYDTQKKMWCSYFKKPVPRK